MVYTKLKNTKIKPVSCQSSKKYSHTKGVNKAGYQALCIGNSEESKNTRKITLFVVAKKKFSYDLMTSAINKKEYMHINAAEVSVLSKGIRL